MPSTKPIGRRPTPFRQRAAGFTLVELMVGLAIGMLISIAAASVIAVTESSRRTTQVGNDMGQVASYTTMLLDRAIRSAGSGFAPAASYAYGCKLFAAKSGTQVLPLPIAGALPAPFASVTTGTAGVFRLAPVVIGNGQTTPAISGSASDVLIVMAGTAGQGEAPMLFSALSQSATLTVGSTVGLAANDQLPGTMLSQYSALYRTVPVDATGPDYINAVAEISTTLTAPALLLALQGLEATAGRQRPYRNAPRTLDLDVLLYGSAQIDSPHLTVPHPRMFERAFVLVPLAELAPRLVSVAQRDALASQAIVRLVD